MAKTTIKTTLSKEEYMKLIEENNVEEQELQSKINQITNFIQLLKLKRIKLGEEMEHIKAKKLNIVEIFNKIKFVRKLNDEQIEREMDELLRKTGLEKSLDYKNT